MPFADLIGNERIKKLLQRAVTDRRIGQSLLMIGPRGVGKYQFALALAQALNCDEPKSGDACGQCNSCRKIAAAEHLDVQTFTNDGQFIKIGQMREMSRDAQFRPYEGRHRVFIVDEADRMNANAANSVLKTLEEPPDSTLIVLVSANPYRMPDTIRSRCQILNFAALPANELERHLIAQGKREPDEARLLSRLARGSIGHALEIDLASYLEMRNRMLEMIDAMASSRDIQRLLGASEYLGRKIEKEEFERHLDTLGVLLSDLLYVKVGAPQEMLTNPDVASQLQRIAASLTTEQIEGWADEIEKITEGMTRNVNRQLASEALIFSS